MTHPTTSPDSTPRETDQEQLARWDRSRARFEAQKGRHASELASYYRRKAEHLRREIRDREARS